MRFRDIVQKYINLEPQRIITSMNDVCIKDTGTAVLFIYAIWSGSARLAFHALSKAVEAYHGSDFQMIVLNNDEQGVPDLAASLGCAVNGYGETFWIRSGVVIHTLAKYGDNESRRLQEYMRDLESTENND